MPWAPSNLTTKGAIGAFHQAMEGVPAIWPNHAMTVQSTSASENYVFPGFLPQPREFLGSRQLQDARDFTYTVENNEYELSMLINRKTWEDDQVGLINARLSELGEVWSSWKDSLFSTLLANGNVSGNNGFDGTTFHADTHATGTTGLVADNNLTGAAAAGTVPTAAEFLTQLETIRGQFLSFTDDQGRPYNGMAATKIRVIVHPLATRAAWEAMNQTAFTGGSGATGEFGSAMLDGMDINLYQASGDSDEMYFSAVGSVRKPFIYQERTGLEIVLKTGVDDVAENNGVLVLTRQRYIMTYGDFRRSILFTWT